MSKYRKSENELAIVHAANRIMLEDIKNTVKNTKDELALLLDAADKIPLIEMAGPQSDVLQDKSNKSLSANNSVRQNSIRVPVALDWDSIVQVASKEVEAHGLNPSQIYLYDLLTPDENIAIQKYLDRPLYERLPWDKWDYIFAFGTGLVGGVFDIILGTPGFGLQEQMADKNSWIGCHLDKFHHLHSGGAPADYQGPHFGGGFHRGLTKAHDLLNPIEGIRQFMDGQFRGFYWVDGKKYFIESPVNQYGNPYQTMDFGAAVLAWMIHMFCDFFSSTSLPIPGTSYIYGMDNRELRIFVQEDLYKSGFNLRHLVLQTIPPIAIEVILRSYTFLRYRRQTVNQDALAQKKMELLAVAHAVSAGFNIGKVIVLQDPLFINLPQLVALARTLIRLVLQEYSRNSFFEKALRNVRDLSQTQKEYEDLVGKQLSTIIVMQ